MPRAVVDAHAVARTIVARAEQQAGAIAERARDEGLQAARVELAARLLDLESARAAALHALAAQTRQAALLAAEHVIAAELALEPARITAIVTEQLERVRRARRVVLHAHPLDCAALRPWLATHRPTLELHEDASLARGGCVVVSDIGTLDARIETRLDRLREALERAEGAA
jgi:flagellar biosynthesis/type III secretory pathway protein FliH